uniref:Uncharacterized protein n=1 Tax=Mycena chlorophos TaxID=658473 RepID=A0ABQ0LUA5_MYCCL|nr:predicted protein [Mycena chlorophos]
MKLRRHRGYLESVARILCEKETVASVFVLTPPKHAPSVACGRTTFAVTACAASRWPFLAETCIRGPGIVAAGLHPLAADPHTTYHLPFTPKTRSASLRPTRSSSLQDSRHSASRHAPPFPSFRRRVRYSNPV